MASNSKARKANSYTEEEMEKACSLVKAKEMGVRAASRLFNVPLSTLRDRLAGIPSYNSMLRTIFTKDEEQQIVDWLIECANKGHKRSIYQLRLAVQAALNEKKATTPFKDNLPGRKWIRLFRQRHPQVSFKLYKPEQAACKSEGNESAETETTSTSPKTKKKVLNDQGATTNNTTLTGPDIGLEVEIQPEPASLNIAEDEHGDCDESKMDMSTSQSTHTDDSTQMVKVLIGIGQELEKSAGRMTVVPTVTDTDIPVLIKQEDCPLSIHFDNDTNPASPSTPYLSNLTLSKSPTHSKSSPSKSTRTKRVRSKTTSISKTSHSKSIPSKSTPTKTVHSKAASNSKISKTTLSKSSTRSKSTRSKSTLFETILCESKPSKITICKSTDSKTKHSRSGRFLLSPDSIPSICISSMPSPTTSVSIPSTSTSITSVSSLSSHSTLIPSTIGSDLSALAHPKPILLPVFPKSAHVQSTSSASSSAHSLLPPSPSSSYPNPSSTYSHPTSTSSFHPKSTTSTTSSFHSNSKSTSSESAPSKSVSIPSSSGFAKPKPVHFLPIQTKSLLSKFVLSKSVPSTSATSANNVENAEIPRPTPSSPPVCQEGSNTKTVDTSGVDANVNNMTHQHALDRLLLMAANLGCNRMMQLLSLLLQGVDANLESRDIEERVFISLYNKVTRNFSCNSKAPTNSSSMETEGMTPVRNKTIVDAPITRRLLSNIDTQTTLRAEEEKKRREEELDRKIREHIMRKRRERNEMISPNQRDKEVEGSRKKMKLND